MRQSSRGDPNDVVVLLSHTVDGDEPVVRTGRIEARAHGLFVQLNGLVRAAYLFQVLRPEVKGNDVLRCRTHLVHLTFARMNY